VTSLAITNIEILNQENFSVKCDSKVAESSTFANNATTALTYTGTVTFEETETHTVEFERALEGSITVGYEADFGVGTASAEVEIGASETNGES